MTEIEQLQANLSKAEADFKALNDLVAALDDVALVETKFKAFDDVARVKAFDELTRSITDLKEATHKAADLAHANLAHAARDAIAAWDAVAAWDAAEAEALAEARAVARRDAAVSMYAAELKWLPPTPTVEQID